MKQGSHNLGGSMNDPTVLARITPLGVTLSTNAGGKRSDLKLTLEQAHNLKELLA